jgi:hypothetical protein
VHRVHAPRRRHARAPPRDRHGRTDNVRSAGRGATALRRPRRRRRGRQTRSRTAGLGWPARPSRPRCTRCTRHDQQHCHGTEHHDHGDHPPGHPPLEPRAQRVEHDGQRQESITGATMWLAALMPATTSTSAADVISRLVVRDEVPFGVMVTGCSSEGRFDAPTQADRRGAARRDRGRRGRPVDDRQAGCATGGSRLGRWLISTEARLG